MSQRKTFRTRISCQSALAGIFGHDSSVAPRQKQAPRPPAVAISPRCPLILLVENREPMRVASKKVLETSGYDLIVVERVSDAVSIAEQYRGRIDFLIIQALPPGLNPGLLAHLFRRKHPETLTLFVAGTREEVLICNGADRNTTVLDQPVSVKVVASAVGELIAKLRRMNTNDSEG